jgi:hypothetical protein
MKEYVEVNEKENTKKSIIEGILKEISGKNVMDSNQNKEVLKLTKQLELFKNDMRLNKNRLDKLQKKYKSETTSDKSNG